MLAKSQELIGMAKRHFWTLFREAWRRAFTTKNIEAAWKATGIYPFNPDKVFVIIEKGANTPSKYQQTTERTPISANAMVRTFNQLHKEGHIDMEAAPLLRAGVRLAADCEILRLENEGLRKAIIVEKKKRKRGKMMALINYGVSTSQTLFLINVMSSNVTYDIA